MTDELLSRRRAAEFSEVYALVHAALQRAAVAHDVTPFEARVLMSVYGGGGSVRSDELERLMLIDGSAIRRAVARLRRRQLLDATSAAGGAPKRGQRSRLTLTVAGVRLVLGVLEYQVAA